MTTRGATDLLTDFRSRPNALGALRLALALLVVVGHSWQLGGYGPEPVLGTTYIAAWGLYGFFAISGFLILRSRLSRPSAKEFYWARFLRIYPGFIVCLLTIAFVFAPISRLLDPQSEWGLRSAGLYIVRNLALYPPQLHQAGIGSTLSTNPFALNWDEPMWSLFYEACCYVIVGVLVSLLPRRSLTAVVPALFVLSTVATFASVTGAIGFPYEVAIGLTLATPFLAGSSICVLASRIPVVRGDLLLSAGLLALVIMSGYTAVFAALPLAHLLLRLSMLLPLTKVGRRWDISYGVYIYGVPVQQIVTLAISPASVPLPVYVLLVLAPLLAIAFASSALVEMPALRLKTWRVRDLKGPTLRRSSRREGVRPTTSSAVAGDQDGLALSNTLAQASPGTDRRRPPAMATTGGDSRAAAE